MHGMITFCRVSVTRRRGRRKAKLLGNNTPPIVDCVKLIKDHFIEAQHKLCPQIGRAESTLPFAAQLWRSVYEMGFLAGQFVPPRRAKTMAKSDTEQSPRGLS